MTAIDFSAFVNELASVSGETILPFFRTALTVEDKGRSGSFDPVTAADHAAETAMRTLIRRTFPDHGIIGEEYGKERADAEYVWVLDPIDGTKSFISGMPNWGTLIALLRSGEPVYGMMSQPFTRERFSGDGGGASYRGPAGERELRVRACADLGKAVLFTTSPRLMNANDRETFGRVEDLVRLSRYGGDCYAYCMLAAGHVDLVIETDLKPYDVLPLVPIIAGAKGIVTTWEGGSPRRVSAMSVPQAGRPQMKDLVPSIGSSTQTYSASGRSAANSSPTMPCSGNVCLIRARMAASAARSAAVTGSKLPDRLLFSTPSAVRKNGRIVSPETAASWSTKATKSIAVIALRSWLEWGVGLRQG